jgi:hypothetical protein
VWNSDKPLTSETIEPGDATLGIPHADATGVTQADLPGTRPRPVPGWLVFVPLPIVMIYTVVAHSIPSYRHSKCFSLMESLTHPITTLIPGVARTVQQLEAIGLHDRATEVGHYLALMWFVSGISLATAILWQWLNWTDSNYIWSMASIRRSREQRSGMTRLQLRIGVPAIMLVALFVGGASHVGRRGFDFAGGELGLVLGEWWIGAAGWLFFLLLWFPTFSFIIWLQSGVLHRSNSRD